MTPAGALAAMDAIALARHRVAGNTPPALALEASDGRRERVGFPH